MSNAGVSVLGLQSLVDKLQRMFELIQLEKERKEKDISSASAATVEDALADSATSVENSDSMMMELMIGVPPQLPP